MVGGDEVLLVAAGGKEYRPVGIVAAIGEELQGQDGASSPPFADHLNGVGTAKLLVGTDDDEIDREAAKDPFLGKPSPDLLSFAGDHGCVFRIGREPAAKIALSAGPAEQLIVSRQ